MKLNFKGLIRQAQHFTADNSPAILTAIGVTGALTASWLTAKATFQAADILDYDTLHRQGSGLEKATRKDHFKLIWKLYMPAAGVLTLTCASIVCANRIGMRRTATAAAALTLAERGFDEYKEQVRDHIGKKEYDKVREKVSTKSVQKTADREGWPMIVTTGKVLCHDEYTNQFFYATINQVDAAVNEANREITQSMTGAVSVSEFYDFIGDGGPKHTSMTDEVGWNEGEMITIKWITVPGPTPESPAAHSYTFETRPRLRPWGNAPFRN